MTTVSKKNKRHKKVCHERKVKFENYKNCFEAIKLENRINCIKKL